MVLVFQNVEERSTAKNYHPVSLLSAVNKVFEKLVNNRIVDHLQKCGLFSDFQYGFTSSQSTPDLHMVVGLLTGLGLLELWHWIYPRLLTGLGILVFFTNLRLMKFQVRCLALFLLFSVIDSFKWFWMESLHKKIQLMLEFLKALILGPTLLLLYISDIPDYVIFNISIYLDDTTLYSKCDEASHLWQQLQLASELGSKLRDTVDWGKKWFVDPNAGKTQLVSFDRSNNNGSIDMKMDGSVLEEKSSFKMLGLTFSSKLDWGSYIISIAKTASKKIGALIRSMKFFLLRLLCISINLRYPNVYNTVVMSGLVPLVPAWKC